MSGLVEGQQPGACNSEIADFFGVVAFHHGHPDLSATSKSKNRFPALRSAQAHPSTYQLDRSGFRERHQVSG
jgi:hypothetical protein